ncbi:MAG: hypothetical protein ACM3SQ_19865 [Betaproteobacteria bacterium]
MDWRRPPGVPGRRWARDVGLVLLAVTGASAGILLLLPLLVRGFVRALELVMTGCVWLAMSISVGVSVWSVLASVGRAGAAVLVTPQGSAVLAILILVAALAIYGLQRLLGSQEESSR